MIRGTPIVYASGTMKEHQKKNGSETREDILVHRDRYRVFIEQVADGFYEVDLKGNFRFFNEAFCRILGCHRGELLDHNYREFMDEDNAKFAFESFNRMYRTGRGVTGILWEIVRKNGQARILEISANPIWNDFGEMTGFRGIAHDVTEQQLAQQASSKSEKLYRTLLDFVPDPLVVFNMEGKVNYLNPAFVKVLRLDAGGTRSTGFIPFVPEDLKGETRQGYPGHHEKPSYPRFRNQKAHQGRPDIGYQPERRRLLRRGRQTRRASPHPSGCDHRKAGGEKQSGPFPDQHGFASGCVS